MNLYGTNGTINEDTGELNEEIFTKPLFQTFGMFVGMLFGLVMHWIVLLFKIPFPGYDHTGVVKNNNEKDVEIASEKTSLVSGSKFGKTISGGEEVTSNNTIPSSKETIPVWMYFFLAIPAIFDLAATALCMMGLQYLDVSIYQMLRGSGIIFVALMKQHVLKEHLHKFHWVGVFWNVISVVIVGATALLATSGEGVDGGSNGNVTSAQTFMGVCLMMAGAFVQAVQFVFEEHAMKMDIPAPPLLLIGMEGFWGTFLGLFVMYPIG